MNPNYETLFENIQNMKANLFHQNKLNNYYEDDSYFYIKTNNTNADIKLRKNKYFYKLYRVGILTSAVQRINKKILSMQRLYVLSRSNIYEKELKELFDLRNKKSLDLEILKQSIKSYPDILFDLISTYTTGIENIKKSSEKPSKPQTKQEKKIKKFLFETYKQCISQKTSEPTYMTKESIIKHIKEHDSALLKILPKNITTMKKGEICKVLFKID